MSTNNLTPEESFTIINKAISNYKINYKDNGNVFLLWGWAMTLASFSHFIILKVLHSLEAYNLMGLFSLLNWTVFMIVAFSIQYFMIRKIKKENKVFSHLDNSIKKVWMVSGMAMFIASFICIKLDILPPTFILVIAGIATTISGLFLKFKPLTIGGMAFFGFSIATLYVPVEFVTLLTGISIICGYLIPGYLLKSVKE